MYMMIRITHFTWHISRFSPSIDFSYSLVFLFIFFLLCFYPASFLPPAASPGPLFRLYCCSFHFASSSAYFFITIIVIIICHRRSLYSIGPGLRDLSNVYKETKRPSWTWCIMCPHLHLLLHLLHWLYTFTFICIAFYRFLFPLLLFLLLLLLHFSISCTRAIERNELTHLLSCIHLCHLLSSFPFLPYFVLVFIKPL